MVKAFFFFFSPVDDVEAPVTYCPVIYFLNRSMLFKENTQSYPRKYTKKAQIAYTFFFFPFALTNVVYLKLVRNMINLGDQTWKRKVISPELGNFAAYCIINIVLLYEKSCSEAFDLSYLD